MKKLIYSAMCLAAFSAVFVSCKEDNDATSPEATKLLVPAVTVESKVLSFEAKWDSVPGAESYIVSFQDAIDTVTTRVYAKDVEAGEYTIKVQSYTTAEGYAPSDWGEANFTVAAPEKLATPVLNVAGGEGTFTATWEQVANAESYVVMFMDNEETVTTCEYSKNVEPGQYTIKVKACTSDKNFAESDWAEGQFEVTAPSFVSDGTWFGTWTVTATHKVVFDEQSTSFNEEENSFEVTISPYDTQTEYQGALIEGWSVLLDDQGNSMPALALIDDASNTLQVLSGVSLGSAGQDDKGEEIEITWMPICEIAGDYSFVGGQFPAISFAMDGVNATGTNYEGELQDGGTFSVVGLEVFGLTSQNVYFFVDGFPVSYPAGTFTMVKTANVSNSPAAAPAMRKVERNFNIYKHIKSPLYFAK